ncbi:uncharacterized protein LOC110178026 isoform X2 [Drosophila serrata]|uniref:uncharacterized protein LOC110178026 isoform X2 n=1 Tax=Drosophila serrata TaxID=7274 RepID=UPI000A1D1B0B|nr:uncharacterized protein LOC110178026 isoform X2 [Drosophila serrata]
MSNTAPILLSRAQQKIRSRARIRERPGTPEDHLNPINMMMEQQRGFRNVVQSPLPTEEDQGEESGYDPDPEDCDLEQETDVYTDMESLQFKVELPNELYAQSQLSENRSRHVSFGNSGEGTTSSPQTPPLLEPPSPEPTSEEPLPLPFLPPRTCSHLKNNNTYPRSTNTNVPQALRLGKCTPPLTFGQGYDPPFLYPEFLAKNQQSRINYILTLVDSLVLQMERFGSLSLNSEGEANGVTTKPSTGAIPKIRPPNGEFRSIPNGNRNRSNSKTHNQSTCDECVAGQTLDVIRGHLSRADYSDASKLAIPEPRNIGRNSSSSSSIGTATLTPNTRPCSPEGQRQATTPKPPKDLEQLLDPTTDWPANKKKESKQERSMLENLFNMTSASPRIKIVAVKRQHQKSSGGSAGAGSGSGSGGGSFVTYTTHRSKNRDASLIPCMKKRNK